MLLDNMNANSRRVKVDCVESNLASGTFVDYGDCFCIMTDDFRHLEPQFTYIPCQAHKAKIAGEFR